jgi:hypothetical protein
MHNNFKHSDYLMFAVIRDGQQKNYILHKSCALLAMDAAWLLNPDDSSQAGDYLSQQAQSDIAFGPLGYGCVCVSFDDRTVYSFQTYKSVAVFNLNEVGFIGASAPAWMDWDEIVNEAFKKQCIRTAIYASKDAGEIHLEIPLLIRERKSPTLRYVTRERPQAYTTVGLGFSPSGWLVRHENVAGKSPARENVIKRVIHNLLRLGATMAPESQWAGFATST